MPKAIFTGLCLMALAACSSGSAREGDGARSGTGARALASGAQIEANLRSELSSPTDSAGQVVEAVVSRDILGQGGVTVIPAGSSVWLSIAALETAQDQGNAKGSIELRALSVEIDGASHPVSASVEQVTYTLVGRGITKAEAARIAAGTAVGAIAGQVIGKNTKSTVIGGAVGAVAGGVVAVRYATRDVVVAAGTPVVLTLTQPFSVTRR
jgi:hypothetical protein